MTPDFNVPLHGGKCFIRPLRVSPVYILCVSEWKIKITTVVKTSHDSDLLNTRLSVLFWVMHSEVISFLHHEMN